MTRLASNSSASLFFGPSIPQTASKTRSRTASNATASAVKPRANAHILAPNRHSYGGPGGETIATLLWRNTLNIPSSDSSPAPLPHGSHDDDDDMFFEPCDPPETSFVFNVTEGTPSPRSKHGKKGKDMLPLKYKPRDSGVALSDDEDATNSARTSFSIMPHNSTSASSLNSDVGDDLITPGVMPNLDSGWPATFIISGSDDGLRTNHDGVDVDAFILRTLAAGGKPSAEGSKKPPGTPVKKLKNAHLGGNRPWQSAVANRVGFNFGGLDLGAAPAGKMKNGPRKSLPAAFPALDAKKGLDLQSDEDDEEENSPSARKELNKYEGLGIGRPPMSSGPAGPVERTRWLMRRSSSGAFSNGSEASLTTPTRRSKGNFHH
jgi:mitosis inhibitor protein kinase SWE1